MTVDVCQGPRPRHASFFQHRINYSPPTIPSESFLIPRDSAHPLIVYGWNRGWAEMRRAIMDGAGKHASHRVWLGPPVGQCCASQVTVKEVIDCQVTINDRQI
jgi:hypothetical protein